MAVKMTVWTRRSWVWRVSDTPEYWLGLRYLFFEGFCGFVSPKVRQVLYVGWTRSGEYGMSWSTSLSAAQSSRDKSACS